MSKLFNNAQCINKRKQDTTITICMVKDQSIFRHLRKSVFLFLTCNICTTCSVKSKRFSTKIRLKEKQEVVVE